MLQQAESASNSRTGKTDRRIPGFYRRVLPPSPRQSHLSGSGLFVPSERSRNSRPPCAHAPIPPHFPGIFPAIGGCGATFLDEAFNMQSPWRWWVLGGFRCLEALEAGKRCCLPASPRLTPTLSTSMLSTPMLPATKPRCAAYWFSNGTARGCTLSARLPPRNRASLS